MESNIIIDILNRQEAERKANKTEWGCSNRSHLVKVLEENGVTISDYMWDMLLTHVNGLRINASGKVCYLSFYPESKRIVQLLSRNAEAIKNKFDYITKC